MKVCSIRLGELILTRYTAPPAFGEIMTRYITVNNLLRIVEQNFVGFTKELSLVCSGVGHRILHQLHLEGSIHIFTNIARKYYIMYSKLIKLGLSNFIKTM